VLRAGGFRPDQITLRHLLAHTSGLSDHTDDPNFLENALENPGRIWTRLEQVRMVVDLGGPLSAPGETYHYSDTGYVLLGEVIEGVTGQPLGPAVRETLDFARFNLSSTWWEGMEEAPAGAKRVQQFVGGRDVTNIHPSIDMFGGGGLAMSVRDLGCLTAALFEGQLFRSPGTLAEMLRPTGARPGDEYRLGVSAMRTKGIEVFGHQGYWGTAAFHAPASKVTVTGFVAERDDRAKLIDVLFACLASTMEKRTIC
jgi:D-alanyl-D-alanine carboxypeptidase